MRKLSDLKGESALDVLADILEPISEILTDKEVANLYRSGMGIRAVSTAIKHHKKAVLDVLAALEGEDPNTYNPPIMALPIKLMEVLNDPDLQMVFQSQDQMMDGSYSGPATVSTEATETK